MLRVLVADDCPDTVTSLQLLLRSWGHEARVAPDGLTALKIAVSLPLDVVLLDLAMPEIDGYRVAKCLRQLDPQKPIIIAHSGYCKEADVRLALEAGCNYHLCKPAEPDELRWLLEFCERLLQNKLSV